MACPSQSLKLLYTVMGQTYILFIEQTPYQINGQCHITFTHYGLVNEWHYGWLGSESHQLALMLVF